MSNELSTRLGQYVTTTSAGEKAQAFIPPILPPQPPLKMEVLYRALEKANVALGRLDGMTTILPDPRYFIYTYVRKEAVLSSQIEGTQSSLSDLLLFEDSDKEVDPMNDVIEVSNYVAAMDHGLKRIREGFPISLRLIREIHNLVLRYGRGSDKQPGEFRRSQNWVGGTRPGNASFVPPPPERLMEALDALEKFINADTPEIPLLIKAGLIHVQFETIHPFSDGNGRVGRLLITLLLCNAGVIKEPLLYLSLYLKSHRQDYYDFLQRVRTHGDWERWLLFFLEGVEQTAIQAIDAAKKILDLFKIDHEYIERLGRPAASAMSVHQLFQNRPVMTIGAISESLKLSMPTVIKSLEHLQSLGIIREVTGKKRGRIFAYKDYLSILSEGTEPLPR